MKISTIAAVLLLAVSTSSANLQFVIPSGSHGFETLPNTGIVAGRDWDREKRQSIPTETQQAPQQQSLFSTNGGIIQLQEMLLNNKQICAKELGYDGDLDKTLLFEPNPTPQEKCLMECILKRAKLMQPNNRLSVQRIGGLAESVSSGNPLVVAIALATAEHCNKFIRATNPCEAAHQINLCIANELKARKIKLFY